MAMRDLLTKWNVGESTIQKFLDNEVTVDDLPTLSEEDLRDLVPLIGPRNKLKLLIQSLKGDPTNKDNEGSNKGNEGTRLTLNAEQSHLLESVVDANSRQDSDSDADLSNASETSDSSESLDSRRPSRSKAKKTMPDSSTDLDLQVLLEKTGDGRLILSVYKNKKRLNDTLRSTLCLIVMNSELKKDLDKRVSKERAEVLAAKIKDLFPTELTSTWYRVEEVASGNGTRKVVKGRLMRKFYSLRRSYKKEGVIVSHDSDDDEEEEESLLEDDPESSGESIAEGIAWLKAKNVSPWTRVLSTWALTSKKRLRELQAEPEADPQTAKARKGKKVTKTSAAKVSSYTAQFPQILEPLGWTLLELDFESYQKDSLLKLTIEFEKLEKFVLHKLRTEHPEKLYDDFHEKSSNERCAFVLLSLSYFFPVQTLRSMKTANKGSWRPSRQEIRDSFLLHVKTYGNLKKTCDDRKKKLEQFGVTDQPLPIIIGDSLSKITKCLLKFDSCEYDMETPIKAVDIAFKSYHSLHASYPAESEALWLFLQKAVYKFNTKWDKNINSVNIMVAEYASFSS